MSHMIQLCGPDLALIVQPCLDKKVTKLTAVTGKEDLHGPIGMLLLESPERPDKLLYHVFQIFRTEMC